MQSALPLRKTCPSRQPLGLPRLAAMPQRGRSGRMRRCGLDPFWQVHAVERPDWKDRDASRRGNTGEGDKQA